MECIQSGENKSLQELLTRVININIGNIYMSWCHHVMVNCHRRYGATDVVSDMNWYCLLFGFQDILGENISSFWSLKWLQVHIL